MASLEKSLRNQLERTVKDARDIAELAARASLEQLGVGDAGPPPHLSQQERDLRRRLRIHGRQLGDRSDDKRKTQQLERLIEEAAYEHWHRMLFARFLAENNLLMYPDPHQPVAISLQECDDLAADEGSRNGWELAARYAAGMLPQIFRVDSPVFEIQLPPENQQQLEKFVSDLPTAVFTASDSLGWVYQFWQARRKDQVNASEVKIGARELPAVTQLFTEDYMVDFLLDNTLGAWHAGKVLVANPKLAETAKSEDELRNAVTLPGCPWAYLRFIQYENGKWSPAAGTFNGWPTAAKELKCLDPCMGSGHFVVAMFERLVALRLAEETLNESEAVASVIRDNLYGLEIDPRCTQIAAFNLALTAWRQIGYCMLRPMNLACSGLAPNTSEEEWLKLAGGNETLENGMASLYQLFENAPVLGSLINPRADRADLLEAGFSDLQPLLERALSQESKDDTTNEIVVTARGLAKAAEILSGQFTLVATNVPYLGRSKQNETLQKYCQRNHPASKTDLATCFVERCLAFCSIHGGTALVTPQNWLSLPSYSRMRLDLLVGCSVDWFAKLGSKAFETIGGEVVNIALVTLVNTKPLEDFYSGGCEIESAETPLEKKQLLKSSIWKRVIQKQITKNPDARITIEAQSKLELLSSFAFSPQGIKTGDDGRFRRTFWELPVATHAWRFYQGSPDKTQFSDGMHFLIDWSCDGAGFSRLQGMAAWGKRGVVLKLMGNFTQSLFHGEQFDSNVTAIIPNDMRQLTAIWCFCASAEFSSTLKRIEAGIKINNATAVKVPFDLEHWQKVASEKYPDGLPSSPLKKSGFALPYVDQRNRHGGVQDGPWSTQVRSATRPVHHRGGSAPFGWTCILRETQSTARRGGFR